MTPLFKKYLTGQSIPGLTMSTARSLLDQARSAILSKSKPPAPALAQSGELMAMAASLEQIEKRAHELEAAGKELPWLNAVVDVQSGTQSPAPKPPVKRDLIADVQEQFARAKELTKAATAKPSMTPTTSTTATPSANDRRLAAALLDEQERREAAALVKTRAQLDAMKPTAIAAFFKNGGKLIS